MIPLSNALTCSHISEMRSLCSHDWHLNKGALKTGILVNLSLQLFFLNNHHESMCWVTPFFLHSVGGREPPASHCPPPMFCFGFFCSCCCFELTLIELYIHVPMRIQKSKKSLSSVSSSLNGDESQSRGEKTQTTLASIPLTVVANIVFSPLVMETNCMKDTKRKLLFN